MANQNPGNAGQESGQATGPLAGESRPTRTETAPVSRGHRLAVWLAWWVLLMSLWVAIDDSFEGDELVVGACVSAAAAVAAELVGHQADIRLQVRAAWLPRALGLPAQVVQHTVLVFTALARTLFTKAPPPHGRFRELPVRYGDDSPLGVTRRVLLTGAQSLAPNEFVLGIDPDRDVMVTHQLVEER